MRKLGQSCTCPLRQYLRNPLLLKSQLSSPPKCTDEQHSSRTQHLAALAEYRSAQISCKVQCKSYKALKILVFNGAVPNHTRNASALYTTYPTLAPYCSTSTLPMWGSPTNTLSGGVWHRQLPTQVPPKSPREYT